MTQDAAVLEPLVLGARLRCHHAPITHTHMALLPGRQVAEDPAVFAYMQWGGTWELGVREPATLGLEYARSGYHVFTDIWTTLVDDDVTEGMLATPFPFGWPLPRGLVVEVGAQTLGVLREVFAQGLDAPVEGALCSPPDLGCALTTNPVLLQFTT